MSLAFDLHGKRVLIVGGASGIGRATALKALEASASVWIFDRAADAIEEETAVYGDAVRTTRIEL